MKIIIIGATSGIGRKLAELYAQKGNRVGITGRRMELLTEIQALYPTLIETECFDVVSNENINRLESLVKKLNGLDLLIYSSGIGEPSKELDWNLEKKTVDINVNGFLEIINWGFTYFKKQNYGTLVTISSVASYRGNSWAPAYSASKAFQSNYFEGLTIKAKRMKKNIFLTCIEPGFVATKMAKGHKLFWVVPLEKAAKQIILAIAQKKRKAFISKRWWLIAKLMKWMPYSFYKRFG